MMRLKQLLGIILLAVLTTTVAAGSSSLAGISVEHRDKASTVAKPVTASTVSVPAVAAPHESTRTSHINNIAVARGKDSLNIEVTGTEPMTAKTMKLTNPDRVVVDIPNSVLEGRSREIPVNSNDVKDIRAARYQAAPPSTRVVVDMSTMHDFEVLPSANKLVLRFKNSDPAQKTGPSAPAPKSFEASLPAVVTPALTGTRPPVVE